MKSYVKLFFSLVIVCLTCFVVYLFRYQTSVPVWDNYSVMYVQKDIDEYIVLDCLEKAGCTNIISLSKQVNPLKKQTSVFAPFIDNGYLAKRDDFFFDKSKSYSLYYIPRDQKKQVEKAVFLLSNLYKAEEIKVGVDLSSKYPIIIPIICSLFMLILFFMAENRVVYLFTAIFPLILSFFLPYYSISSAVCLFELSFFFVQRLWGRRKKYFQAFCNSCVIVFWLIGLSVCFFESYQAGLSAISVLLGSIIGAVIVHIFQEKLEKKRRFSYVYIVSPKLFPVLSKKGVIACFISIVPLGTLFLLNMSGSGKNVSTSVSDLCIPSPVIAENQVATLVNLEDYYEWTWDVLTFPYKNLNGVEDSVCENKKVLVNHYVSTETGIQVTEEVLYEYNDDFKELAMNLLDELEYPAVEKLWQSQETFVGFDYVNLNFKYSDWQKESSLSGILLCVVFAVPFILLIYYYIFGKKRNESC